MGENFSLDKWKSINEISDIPQDKLLLWHPGGTEISGKITWTFKDVLKEIEDHEGLHWEIYNEETGECYSIYDFEYWKEII